MQQLARACSKLQVLPAVLLTELVGDAGVG